MAPIKRLVTSAEAGDKPTEYLTFTVGNEEYGVDLQAVQELRGCADLTAVPGAAPQVAGTIDVLGNPVPVTAMRARLGLEKAGRDAYTVIVVLRAGGRMAGLVVDGVSDVATFYAGQLRPPPASGSALAAHFLSASCMAGRRVVLLIDVLKLLAADDWTAAQ
ncbi:MAG TPA: chemotaxis protein CheW [Telluria sp.]